MNCEMTEEVKAEFEEVKSEFEEVKAEFKDNLKDDESYTGIPEAQFIDDVDAYMKKEDNDASVVLKKLEEQLSKYKFMELHLQTKRKKLRLQIPDIKSSLDIIEEMKKRKDSTDPLETQFMLSEQVYMKAIIPPTDRVCLWLGANVMLDYGLEDANSLLWKNYSNAKKSLTQAEHDLDYLRNQFTTTEVTMARVYNWDVKRRRTITKAAK